MKSLLVLVLTLLIYPSLYSAELKGISQYSMLRDDAIRLAGNFDDIEQRVELFREMYFDSGGHYQFPAIAMHGALWLSAFKQTTIEKHDRFCSFQLTSVFACSKTVKSYIRSILNEILKINRTVFIDTYSLYYFSKYHPEKLPQNLSFLKDAHSKNLNQLQMKTLFKKSLLYEQSSSVTKAMNKIYTSIPSLIRPFFKATVRFDYFPENISFNNRNYFNESHRIEDALTAYELGIKVGFDKVMEMTQY